MEETARQPVADRLDPARAAALWSALGRGGPPPGPGDPLPALFHHLYFWSVPAPGEVGRDGHAALGSLIPDLGLPRRLWAGGRITFHAPLRLGIAAERSTMVRAVTRKEGRTGRLGFVTLRHEVRQRGALALSEDQDLVYRPAPDTGDDPPPAPIIEEPPTTCRAVAFDPVLLFRYSALTMNGHRIHYDAPFAAAEGYRGLVVHGPLLALMLAGLAQERLGALTYFQFRATAPLCLPDVAELCARDDHFWARGPDRRLVMTAKAG